MRTPGPLLCSRSIPPPGKPRTRLSISSQTFPPLCLPRGHRRTPPGPTSSAAPRKRWGRRRRGGGGEGKKPVPEQRFVFLSSQHCYGDFKQDGGALPPHRSPACTHRSPFPRKRGGKGGGGLHRAGALHLPAGATPSSAGTASGFPTATHTHTHRTPPPQVHRARTLWGCGSSGRGSQHS